MNRQDVLLMLDELIEVAPGTLQGDENVTDWDSIVLLGLIALADEKFNKSITLKQIKEKTSVNDIIDLLLE